MKYKSWPFVEAAKVLRRKLSQLSNQAKKYAEKSEPQQSQLNNKQLIEIIFETGYGPSGLPHIGTFCEVFRTSLIITALKELIAHQTLASEYPDVNLNNLDFKIRLICFSDDMDGLKKIPLNIPNQDLIAQYIGQPLTAVPDPFGIESSYGAFMNKKLKSFLDKFGLEYEFVSSSECYKSGFFNDALKVVLNRYDSIMNLMLPSLGEERQKTYSPFLPICKETNKVLQVPVVELRPDSAEIVYEHEGKKVVTSILNGNVKLQWKVDFGMRWMHLGVDYEMYGADHQPNAKLYSNICRALGGEVPLQFFYGLFLDSEGNKISKSKGNSISIDEWLKYAPIESLGLYAFNNPVRSKRLYFDVIPKLTDDYLAGNAKFNQDLHNNQDDTVSDPDFEVSMKDNIIYLMHNTICSESSLDSYSNIQGYNNVPKIYMGKLSFGLLLNLASACNPENIEVLKGFVRKYDDTIDTSSSFIARLLQGAIYYYQDFIKPKKQYVNPTDTQIKILEDILRYISEVDLNSTEEEIQNMFFTIGKKYYDKSELRTFFAGLYQVLLGEQEGPRWGTFVKLFGIHNFKQLVQDRINNPTNIPAVNNLG